MSLNILYVDSVTFWLGGEWVYIIDFIFPLGYNLI